LACGSERELNKTIGNIQESVAMCGSADVFRQRADHLMRIGKGEKDPELQKIYQTMAASYEALARNEEWLEGEVIPLLDTRHAGVTGIEGFGAS
jgi:hypothetical protein